MSFHQIACCQLLLKIKMQISGQKFDTRSSLRGSWTLWGWLCGRVELVMPLQPFHCNLTYAVLCTIASFEALIKGMSSNRARKQKQKQMILFQPQSDVYLLLIMASPPTDFTQQSPCFLHFPPLVPPCVCQDKSWLTDTTAWPTLLTNLSTY